MWVVCSTRPDLIVDVTMLANRLNKPQSKHAHQANKALIYLQGSTHKCIHQSNPTTTAICKL